MARRNDIKNNSIITSLGGGGHDDLRLVWMAQYICKCFPDIPDDAIRWYFKENRKSFQEMLDEKVVFKSLFFQNIYDPSKDERRLKKLEREAAQVKAAEEAAEEKRRRALLLAEGGAEGGEEILENYDEEDEDEEEEEEDEEDLMYYGPPPVPLKLYRDKITDWFHPFDLNFVYFTRLDRGPIGEPQSLDQLDVKMSSMLLRGCVDRDPLQMLYELLDSHSIVKNADPEKNFEDKYILQFYKRIKAYAGRVEGELTLRIPQDLRPLYAAPFSSEEAAKDPEAVRVLNDCCYEWIQSVESVLNDITKSRAAAKNSNDPNSNKADNHAGAEAAGTVANSAMVVDNDVLNEINMWEERLRRFEGMEEQLKMNAIERSLRILHAAGNIHAKTLTNYINQIRGLLEEAQDNVKFLSTIRKPTQVLVTSVDFKEMRTTLPNLMNSLRNIWMLSKHFNTDDQICGLLDKITNIILARVRGFVDFKLLHSPEEAERISKESQSLLTGWDESFRKTRRAIEESGREARWEFSVQKQFSQVHHASKVCSDIAEVANILSQLQHCFTDALIRCTRKPDLIIKAKQRTQEMTESFAKLHYEAFDPSNAHHWKNHIDWFHREVRFVDAESASIAEEVYDHLLSSKLAIDALFSMIQTNYRKDIGRRFLAKVGLVIKKFTVEIQEDESMFRSKMGDPPVAENLPPISGAIYWSNDIEKNLAQTLNSLSAVSHVVDHGTWPSALERYEAFLRELHKYKMRRYDEWRYRVSDILDANLTRTLLLTLPPREGAKAERYLVNFTTDLSDTLAEVKHLEHLGFTVPEVARNMSLQEGKLTGIAADLRKLVDKYHSAIDSLNPAEEELMLPELSVTQTSLSPGHLRLTWNSMGIKEFIQAGNQKISSLISKIRQIEILRLQLQEIIDYVENKKLLLYDDKGLSHEGGKKIDNSADLPAFEAFFQFKYEYLETMYKELLEKVSLMAPLLIKVEEILVATRTQRAPRLSSYYLHWERKLFEAVAEMTARNLEEYSSFLRQKCPQFTIRSKLVQNDVIIEPEASFVLDGAIKVVKHMVENTRRFVRFYKGSFIPVKPVYIMGYLNRVIPSFYDEISSLPNIVHKVETIQNSLIDILKMMFNYLNEWKGYRSVWRYSKDMTCAKFVDQSPTCVDFDEKLLFYYNMRRTIESALDVKDFRCIRLQLRPLKNGILKHIDEWISTLGKLLEQTAWDRLEKITYKVEDYSSRLKEIRHSSELERTLVLISDIWDMTLEFEIYYMDIQERCRTLDMYGIKSEKNIVSLSADLPKTWNDLYIKSKEIYFRIFNLKEKNSQVVMQKVNRLAKKLKELWDRFRTEGPSSEAKSLEEGLTSLSIFRSQLEAIDKQIIELNDYQKVLKMPLTDFEVFTILRTEFENLEEIYKVFQELQNTTSRIEELTCDIYFAAPDKFSLTAVEKEVEELKARFGDHVVLQKLEAKMKSFASYQRIIYLLNNDKLRSRHWEILLQRTSVQTEDEYMSFQLNLFLHLEQTEFESVIVDAIDIAQEEARIEEELTAIRLRWEERKFILTREKITLGKNSSSGGSSSGTSSGSSHKLTIINQFAQLNEEVEQDDAMIEHMLHSIKSAFFKPDLEKMKNILAEITAILKTWMATQENCLILARVLLTFVSAEIREVDEIRSDFEEDFKMYNKLMEEVAKKPVVSKCCLLPERRTMLRTYKTKFLAHKKSCRKLIELKLKSLPRLSFLSDQESLILLGGLTGDKAVFQKVTRKVLGQSFSALVFEAAGPKAADREDASSTVTTVTQVESINGESLQIFRTVDCRQPTDVWLSQLIDEMCRAVKNYMRRALKEELTIQDYSFENYNSTVELISIARFNILWTTTVEEIFDSEHPLNEAKDVYQNLTSKVATLCKEVIHVNEKDQVTFSKARNLLNIFLSKRNQLFSFLQKNITSNGDFGWKSSFRLVAKRGHDDIEARQGHSVQKFGNEYQAAFTVPIETESTLKAQFAMFMSLHEYKPIYLRGSIYSGKSSCITELAFRLGRYLVHLNLNPSFSPADMVNSLQGLCRANCWAHYDGFDLLDYETLSILTTQLQQINLAQSMNLKEFHLSGKKTQLGLQTGFFFISRNSEVQTLPPISLSSQFRQVHLQQPNVAPLIQAELLAKGFGSPKSLTNSLMAIIDSFYKITTPGFRHVPKLTLVREIFSRLPMVEKVELSHVAVAVMETMTWILPSTDIDIIGPFIREHFPESNVEVNVTADPDAPLAKIEQGLALKIEKGMWPMIVGPMASGKSQTIANAAKILKETSQNNYAVVEVKLARHSVKELFGQEDPSGKWNLGIITRFLAPNAKPTIIVIVTPISGNVAHNFASMFDQGYFQTESDHSFAIPEQIKFVFEATNIACVSPLLSARCSIMHLPKLNKVYFEEYFNDKELIDEVFKTLMTAVESFPVRDDLKSMEGKMDQFETIYNIVSGRADNDEVSIISNLIYAFCWSFGAVLQEEDDVTKFDNAIRKAIKESEIFQKIALIEKCNIFQQTFDPKLKIWEDKESPFAAILELIKCLLANDKPVILVGDLETKIILRILESQWADNEDNGSVLKMTIGSQTTKETCMDMLTAMFVRQDEYHLQPADGKRLLWMVRQLETRQIQRENCLISMIADIAKNKTVYVKESGYRRKKMNHLAFIGQINKFEGTELLGSFQELNYFHVLSAKICTPSAVLSKQNLGPNIPQDILDLTLAIHNDLSIAFAENNAASSSSGRILSLHSLETILRCVKLNSPYTSSSSAVAAGDGNDDACDKENKLEEEESIRSAWRENVKQHLYLPLWTQSDRDTVRKILAQHDVTIDESNEVNIFQKTCGHIEKAIDGAGRRLLVLVGMAGVGKRSSISQTCQKVNLTLFPKLIDPTTVEPTIFDQDLGGEEEDNQNRERRKMACVINNLLFASMTNPQDTDIYVHEIKLRLLPLQHLTTFLSLSVVHYQPLLLKRLITQLRQEGATIIGVPEWTPQDLRACFDSSEAELGTDSLLRIHTALDVFSKNISTSYNPTPAMLSLAHKVTDARIKSRSHVIATRSALLENVLGELVALDGRVEASQNQLTTILEELSTNQRQKSQMTEDMESTKLTLETTMEQKTALKRQIPDFQRQVEVRKHDLTASTAKRHTVYDKALEILKDKSGKDIEKFTSRLSVSPEVEVICSAVLVITEGMKYPESGEPMYVWNHFRSAFAQEEWRVQFYSIDPERHGTVTAFFLERRMKEFRKLGPKRATLAKEEPIADALLEYCEGFLEIINTVEERIEMESRLKVYEEMFVNMNSEVSRLQTTEDTLNVQLKTLGESMVNIEAKMKMLEMEIEDRKKKLQMAQDMANALVNQREHWATQLSDLRVERQSLEERETVVTAASVYLVELPQAKRALGLEVIEEAAVQGSSGKYAHLGNVFDPCYRKNILNQQQLPGWEEGLLKRFCVVYDPHNILIDLFTDAQPKLLYIEELEDLEAIRSIIDEAVEGDTLVLNFGSNVNIIFEVIIELKKMCSTKVAIFLCLSQLTPLPSRVTFVNLDMSGKELRKMTLHLFSLKEGADSDTSKKVASSSDTSQKEMRDIESQLMNVIMTPKPLPLRHKSIVELSQKMDGYRQERRSSIDLSASVANMEHGSTPSVRPEVLLPTAIFAACCDMSTIGDRPFMSLSQFVNFTWNRIQDMSDDQQESDVAELHQVIFQRYCLAFSDREQLLFQTFIMLHLGILNGTLEEDDLKDFLNVTAGHEKKDFAVPCPDWADPADWHHLKKIVTEKNYYYAVKSLEDQEDYWKDWYQHTLDHKDGKDFVSFLIKCALRQKLLPIHLSHFVTSRITSSMQVPSNLCLDYVHSFSTSTSPILLFIDKSAVEDPTFYLKKLADVQGIASTKVKYFALGAGNGATACSLLDTAFVRGQWLIFQNLQLVPNIIVALQRRIDEAKDIHEDFRLWFTWEHTALPQLQLLQRSIVIHCQPIRAIRYHTNTFVYSLSESIFEKAGTKRNIMCSLIHLHRRWEWSTDYAAFYWHAAFRMHSTNILMDMYQYADDFSSEILSTTSGGVRRKVTGEQLHDRLTKYLSFIYSHYVQNGDLRLLELEVGEVLLTLLVDEIVVINGEKEELKKQLCQTLMPAIQAPGNIGKTLNLPRTADVIYNRYLYSSIQRSAGRLLDQVNRFYTVSFSYEDLMGQAQGLQELIESFHGSDYSEDTIYRESIDELVLIREKKEFHGKVSRLINEIISRFTRECDQEWFQQLRTPEHWQAISAVSNRRLDSWLTELSVKVTNFLGDVDPVNLGWFYDPLRYLNAVSIRHLISSNLGTTSTEFLITLSGIKDIHELKEGLHSGCYANGIHLFGATWTNNEEGPVPTHELLPGTEDIVQDLGIVSLVPIESDKLKNHSVIPLHRGVGIDHREETFIMNLRVVSRSKLPLTCSVKFLLSPNV